MLSATAPDVYQTRPGVLGRFHIALAGINYRGTLERVVVTTADDGWITINLGLRNLVAEIGSTTIKSRLISANAGPMDIVVGQTRPAWVIFKLRPKIVDKRIKFEVGRRELTIDDDNYYVTAPQVGVAGMPLLRNRISNAVSSKLVEGAYSKKTEIEERVIDAIPALVTRLEQAVEKELVSTREIGGWPVPALQPRYRLWIDSLRVDQHGLSMILGAVFARPGLDPAPRPVRRLERETVKLDSVPPRRGLTIGVSGALAEGLTGTIVDSGAAVMNANDMSIREFGAFGDIDQIARAVPDLRRFGDALRIRPRIKAVEPILCNALEPQQPAQAAASGPQPTASGPKCRVRLSMPHVILSIEIKTSPGQAQWQTCAEFDLSAVQDFQLSVHEPTFTERTFLFKKTGPEQITTKGRFA
jgi:hypothetical protein